MTEHTDGSGVDLDFAPIAERPSEPIFEVLSLRSRLCVLLGLVGETSERDLEDAIWRMAQDVAVARQALGCGQGDNWVDHVRFAGADYRFPGRVVVRWVQDMARKSAEDARFPFSRAIRTQYQAEASLAGRLARRMRDYGVAMTWHDLVEDCCEILEKLGLNPMAGNYPMAQAADEVGLLVQELKERRLAAELDKVPVGTVAQDDVGHQWVKVTAVMWAKVGGGMFPRTGLSLARRSPRLTKGETANSPAVRETLESFIDSSTHDETVAPEAQA